MGVTDFHRNGSPSWNDNILDPRYSWGYGGTTTNKKWGSKHRGPSGSVAIPWNHPVRVLPVYVRMISENTCAAARRVCDNHPQSNCLALMHSLYNRLNPIRNLRVNQRNDDWEGPVDQ